MRCQKGIYISCLWFSPLNLFDFEWETCCKIKPAIFCDHFQPVVFSLLNISERRILVLKDQPHNYFAATSLSFYQFLYIFSLHLSFSLSVSFFLSFSLSSLLSLFLSVSVCLSIGITFPLFLSFSVCLYSSWCLCAPNYFQPPIASRKCSDQSQSLRF